MLRTVSNDGVIRFIRMVYLYRRVFGPWRGLALLMMATVSVRKTVHAKLHCEGTPHTIALRTGTSDVETFHDVILEGEYEFPLDKHPETIVDAGANVGYSSIWYAMKYPDTRIIAIEPDPDNYALLVSNTTPFPNIETMQAAVWSHEGPVLVTDPGRGSWGLQISEVDHEAVRDSVDGATVDQIMAEHGIDHIDLLKVDIEGSEREVFSDPSLWIDRVGAIAIELHDRFKPGCSRAFYSATTDFPVELSHGSNHFVARTDPSSPS